MGMNWCEDKPHDLVMQMNDINDLWEVQCMGKATQARCDEIERRLEKLKRQIETTILDLSLWGP